MHRFATIHHFTEEIVLAKKWNAKGTDGVALHEFDWNLSIIFLSVAKLLFCKVFHSQLLKKMISMRRARAHKKKNKIARMLSKLVEWHILFRLWRDNLPKPLSCHIITFSRCGRLRERKRGEERERERGCTRRTTADWKKNAENFSKVIIHRRKHEYEKPLPERERVCAV